MFGSVGGVNQTALPNVGEPHPVSGSPEDKKRLNLPWVALVWNIPPCLWTQTKISALPGCQAFRLGTGNTPLSLWGLQLACVYIPCSFCVSGQP